MNQELLICDCEATHLIAAIVKRLRTECPHMKFDGISLSMDLSVCHNLGHVDLPTLVSAKLGDFVHDLNGIIRHLDRETGNLNDCFVPRCKD